MLPSRELPRPWDKQHIAGGAYVFASDKAVSAEWKMREAELSTYVKHLGPSRVAELVDRCRRDGLSERMLPYGFDMTSLLLSRPETDSDVRHLLRMYYPDVWSRLMLEYDQPARRAAATERTPMPPLLRALQADGFAKVSDWGLDMSSLAQQVAGAIESKLKHEAWQADRPLAFTAPLPALGPLLSDTILAESVHAYLGGGARYEGHEILVLPPKVRPVIEPTPPANRRPNREPRSVG